MDPIWPLVWRAIKALIVEACINRVSTAVILEEGTIQLRVTIRTRVQALIG